MAVTQEDVLNALRDCYDPEIPVNIVDLGLIYDIKIEPDPAKPHVRQNIIVAMTMTSTGCPSHVEISQQVKDRIEQMPGITTATVNLVWNPPWGPERLSAAAREKLGIEV
jgi:metal-sulfur cluster biosynthetic enzyme